MIAGFMSGMAGNIQRLCDGLDLRRLSAIAEQKGFRQTLSQYGRWSSVLGVVISIGTAYALFYFSNILEYLQVLVFFFIGAVIWYSYSRMLWKRATPAAGFWGFLTAILVSDEHVGLCPYIPRRLSTATQSCY